MANKLKYLAFLLFCQPVFALTGIGNQLGYVTITSATITNGAKFSNINSGSNQCIHVDGNGNISGTGADCGSGGGGTSSTIATSSGSAINSVIISSPTSNIVFDSNTFTLSLQGITTSFATIASSNVKTGNVVAVFYSSGSDQTTNSTAVYKPCLDYSSTMSVTLGDYLYFFMIAQADTASANGEIEFQMFQDGSSITSGASGLGLIFNANRIVFMEAMTFWFKPLDSNVHNYNLQFASTNGNGANVACGNGENFMIVQEIHR